MEAAALADLPVHPEPRGVVHLLAIHAEVGDPRIGVLGVDQR